MDWVPKSVQDGCVSRIRSIQRGYFRFRAEMVLQQLALPMVEGLSVHSVLAAKIALSLAAQLLVLR